MRLIRQTDVEVIDGAGWWCGSRQIGTTDGNTSSTKETTMIRSHLRRIGLAGAAAGAAVLIGASPAIAEHCYVPMYSLNGPASPNWDVYSAERGASVFAEYEASCQGAVDAGYAALRAKQMPVGIKMFTKMTIGDPKGTHRMNPNGADGKGLEYFEAESTLAEDILTVWIGAAAQHECP